MLEKIGYSEELIERLLHHEATHPGSYLILWNYADAVIRVQESGGSDGLEIQVLFKVLMKEIGPYL